jgi:hypothetical protein
MFVKMTICNVIYIICIIILINCTILFSVPASSLRKVKTVIESLHTEKIKMEKEKTKKSKGKGKATLRIEGKSDYNLSSYENDYDDFM